MTWRSLTELWWRLTFQQTICVLGNLRDLRSFCDLSIHFLTALSFIFPMQVLYCVTLSLEAIHCVEMYLFFSYFFARHHHKIVFLVQFALQGSRKNVCFCCTSPQRTHLMLWKLLFLGFFVGWFFRKAGCWKRWVFKFAAPCKNNLGTCYESCECFLHFSKAKRGQRVTGHNNGRKSRLHSQPFTLSKQICTSLPLIPCWWHTHTNKRTQFLSHADSTAWPTPEGCVKSQHCSRGLTGGHESPYTPAPEHSGQVVCHTSLEESGSVLW